MMALSPEEGAQRLYKLLYGVDPPENVPAAPEIRHGRKPKIEQPPLPYKFPIIGIKSVEDMLAEALASKTPTEEETEMPKPKKKCGECGEMRPIIGRGLCAKCYYHARKSENDSGGSLTEKKKKRGAKPKTPAPPNPNPPGDAFDTEAKQRARAIADATTGQDIPTVPEPATEIPFPSLVMHGPVQPDPPEAGEAVESLPVSDLEFPFPDEPAAEGELTVVVDFTGFPELYQHLLNYAEEQDRTPEGQARWLIRGALTRRD